MSSYLTVYVKLKNVEKPAPIISWSRNNVVYQAMYHNVAYIGNGDEWQFSDLTEDLINNTIEEINHKTKKSKAYLEEYEKHAGGNEDYIHSIIEIKEELGYAEHAIRELEFLRSIVQEVSYGVYSDEDPVINVEKYLVNVD